MTASVAAALKKSTRAPNSAVLQSDAATRRSTGRERIRGFLLFAGSVFLGVTVGGIPWSLYDVNGHGPLVTVSGFVAYLVLSDLRGRL